MARHKVHKAQREASAAAAAADQAMGELEKQTRLEKEKNDRERMKAQRLLARSLRAGAGGFFETDAGSTLGGSGVIG
jgi:anti-sigma factor RsiW